MPHHKTARGADPKSLSTGRPVAMGTHGAVASPHYLASQVGLNILRKGGSAADSAIAMNTVLSVVLNHMSGLGGDMFCQIWDSKSGRLEAINGSGRSGQNVNIEFYKDKGHDEIPKRGPIAANTVPGTVDAWWELHLRYGKLDWNELFHDAISFAEEGFPISEKFRNFINEYSDTLSQFDETANIYLPNGKAPRTGTIFNQKDLAHSMRIVAKEGPEAFYKGELCEKIVQSLQRHGGLLTDEDFAEHRSEWVEPIQTNYKGYTVTEMPPNTQGMATLLILNIIENFDLNVLSDNTADFYHLMTEAVKIAFADRDRWVTDPNFAQIPMQELLSKEHGQKMKDLIDMHTARSSEEAEKEAARLAADGGDTVYLCAVDEEGNACSLIQSVFFEFGSAFIPEGTGILMQNRGSYFKLDPEHPNHLEPRKRTFHTIIPAMALKDDKPFMCFGTMGGEGQPQTQTAMLTRVVDFDYNIQQAIEAPRWLYGRTWGEETKTLKLEGRVPDSVVNNLKNRGHELELLEDWSGTMGHAQGIVIDQESGVLQAGADPRGDGTALAW